MSAGIPRAIAARSGYPDPSGDAGFTLIEVIVGLLLMTIAMAVATTFFISSMSLTGRQNGKQAAVQVAQDALELARSIKPTAILTGRGDCASQPTQCTPVASVAVPYLDLTLASDAGLRWDRPTGTAPLPTTGKSVTSSGITYSEHWYTKCWHLVDGTACTGSEPAGTVDMVRIVVAVTWSSGNCPGGQCGYAGATMISASGDPLFVSNQNAAPPTITNPGAQSSEQGVAASLTMSASHGAPPLTWAFSGLPAGLSGTANGVISGTPTTVGTSTITVTVTDSFNNVGTTTFSWTIKTAVTVATPSAQTNSTAGAISAVQVTASNGVSPYTWTATGLPPGLSINGSGQVTGTPTTTGTYSSVKVTVTDSAGASATTNAFTWTINPPPAVTAPAPRTDASGSAVSVQATATGGVGPYTWAASNLPAGLTLNTSTGLISGTPSAGTRYLTTLTVTDSKGATANTTFAWTITGGLTISSPSTDRTGDHTGTAVSVLPVATGGSGGYHWSATGLPTGVSINSTTGLMSGTPSQAGTFTVKLKCTDSSSTTATMMFTWTVQ